jgi:uncharacterized protein
LLRLAPPGHRVDRYKGVAVRVRGYAEGVPCWAELRTSDPGSAAAFYRELFGWQFDPVEGLFRRGGYAVAGVVTAARYPAGWLTYLAGDDLDGLTELAVDSGGALVQAPREVPARGRSAVLADPAGATFGIWQRGGFAGAQIGSEPGTMCFTELITPDVPTAAAFYGKMFGWSAQPGEMAPGRQYLDWLLGDRVVAGLVEAAGEPAQWRTTVEVADLDEVRGRCLDRYGQVALEPIEVSVGRYARLVDPYGAVFGVIELIPELRDLAH